LFSRANPGCIVAVITRMIRVDLLNVSEMRQYSMARTSGKDCMRKLSQADAWIRPPFDGTLPPCPKAQQNHPVDRAVDRENGYNVRVRTLTLNAAPPLRQGGQTASPMGLL
jgi:hypothetical protein